MAYQMSGAQLAQNKAQAIVNSAPMKRNDPTYHDKAQTFINSSKKLGYKVSAEGDQIIATPPTKAKPVSPVMRGVKMARDAAGVAGSMIKKVVTDPLNLEAMGRITGKAKR